MPIRACVFDAYGTLFDVAAAARACAGEPGREALADRWVEVAATWRDKQLQYTWLRALSNTYTDFWTVTQQALDFALEAHGLTEAGLRERLLQLYFELAAFPEAPDMLRALKAQGKTLAILSNGEPKMLAAAAQSAGVSDLLDGVFSVEEVGVFKPHPSVYDLVGGHLGVAKHEVAFVSSNCWDACSAADYGFRVYWVNRKGEPVDRLAAQPHEILSDLSGLPDRVAAA